MSREVPPRPARIFGSFVLLAVSTVSWSCQRGPAEKLVRVPEYAPVGQSKCNVQASPTRPLVVEWPAGDRASLEARLGRGLVAVRARGCDIEVLRQCSVPGTYAYRGLTRKNDQVLITNDDELYAQLPIGAVRLAGKLARSGRLDVRMALVGMLEAPAERVLADKLSGDCEGATHVIAGVQLGAFEFYAGGSGEIGAGIGVGQAGLGGRSEASRELLSADGDPSHCNESTSLDVRPPEGCGAVIRIELARLVAAAPPKPEATCPSGSRWDGGRCVISQTYCPSGTRSVSGQCVSEQTTPPAAWTDSNEAFCQDLCDTLARCAAESIGEPLPRGEVLARNLRECQVGCEGWQLTDSKRSQLRGCISGSCASLTACTGG